MLDADKGRLIGQAGFNSSSGALVSGYPTCIAATNATAHPRARLPT